jgi:hypothetical protein
MRFVQILVILVCGISLGVLALACGVSSNWGYVFAIMSVAFLTLAVSALAFRGYSRDYPRELGNVFDGPLILVLLLNLAIVWTIGGVGWALRHGIRFDRASVIFFGGVSLGVIIATVCEHRRNSRVKEKVSV